LTAAAKTLAVADRAQLAGHRGGGVARRRGHARVGVCWGKEPGEGPDAVVLGEWL